MQLPEKVTVGESVSVVVTRADGSVDMTPAERFAEALRRVLEKLRGATLTQQ